jgi:hypothetical protein
MIKMNDIRAANKTIPEWGKWEDAKATGSGCCGSVT